MEAVHYKGTVAPVTLNGFRAFAEETEARQRTACLLARALGFRVADIHAPHIFSAQQHLHKLLRKVQCSPRYLVQAIM